MSALSFDSEPIPFSHNHEMIAAHSQALAIVKSNSDPQFYDMVHQFIVDAWRRLSMIFTSLTLRSWVIEQCLYCYSP